jgi:tetratricopeptide (TPR) repeat protein
MRFDLSRILLTVALLQAAPLPAALSAADPPAASSSDARIEFYQARLRDDPEHYPSHALLGGTYFDKAQETLDPQWLAKARAALIRSLEIQPNFPALKLLAATANYRHRFEEALDWAARAAKAAPSDASLVAMRVEAHLALGQLAEARKLVDSQPATENDFYRAATSGHVLLTEGRDDEAIEAFVQASDIAQQQKATTLAVWARVRAAGVLIDSGHADRAGPHLEAAARLDATDRFLRIHQIEVLQAEGKQQQALEAYEKLLQEQPDPELHHRAFLLATGLKLENEAKRHFLAGEQLLRKPLDAGEVYTLEGLSRLYTEAGVKLDEARELAERNLKYKRDQGAVEQWKRVE